MCWLRHLWEAVPMDRKDDVIVLGTFAVLGLIAYAVSRI